MQERRALGKGLSSLIPLGSRQESDNKDYFDCPLTDIIPSENQPRKLFNKEAIEELASSIEEKGILQPLLVRPLDNDRYELIAGERRFRASQILGLETVPVIVKDVEEQEKLELALIENIQRENLNPVEEALAYKELLSKYQYTQDELAKRVGRDRSSIANTLRILKLPDSIRSHLISEKISMGHARALLAIDNQAFQEKIAENIISENLSVREVETFIREMKDKPVSSTTEISKNPIKKKTSKEINEAAKQLSEKLIQHLKTKVQVIEKNKKGKITIHFHSEEELNKIFNLLTAENEIV